MNEDMLSFIVSSKGRPRELTSCLASLALQDCPKEVIVAGTAADEPVRDLIVYICATQGAVYYDTGKEYLYEASNAVVAHSHGYWLAFPNDDCYLVPGYGSIMVNSARQFKWDFVTCGIIYDPRARGYYDVMYPTLKIGCIDKIQYVIHKPLWDDLGGFPIIENPYETDGKLAEMVAEIGAHWGIVRGILGVHN